MTPFARLSRTFTGSLAALTFLAALSVLTACASTRTPAPAAQPGPAMWVVRDEDSTIYLFGTVHVLKPEVRWRTAKVDAALAASDELILEIREVDDAAAMTPLIQQYGLDMKTPLSAKLTAADRARLAEVAEPLGIPVAGLEPLRPWLVSVTLTVASLTKRGFDLEAGVDRLLKAQATAAGKPINAFETAEQQMRFFAGFPPEIELEMLRQALEDIDEGVATLDRLAAGWAVGDLSILEDELVDEMKAQSPELYQVIIVDRNVDWARQIEEKMKGAGTSFVAVGSGHLVGPDSVQEQLRRRGIASTRY